MSKADIRKRFRDYANSFDDSVTDEELDEFLDEFADMVAAHEHRLRYEEKNYKDSRRTTEQFTRAASILPGTANREVQESLRQTMAFPFSFGFSQSNH